MKTRKRLAPRTSKESEKADERPYFFIFAGPNGSGKSTYAGGTEILKLGRTIWIIDPDRLTKRIVEVEGATDANRLAVERIEAWLAASISTHQTIGVETVLSTPKYRKHVVRAKSLGYAFYLIYVALENVELNIKRVKLRFEKGGHDVPEDKIRSRYTRSMEQLTWFLNEADFAQIYDNSGDEPKLLALKQGGLIIVDEAHSHPDITAAITRIASTPSG